MNKTLPVIAIIIVVLVVAVVLVEYPNIVPKASVSTGTASVPIAMTDPAEIPANTTSLYISYSSFRVVYFTANASANTLNVNVSGSVNLLSLVNVSKVLAVAALPANSFIKEVQFNVVSANATINGTTYNVSVLSPIVTATVPASFNKINSSSSLVLDFTPALITVYAANSTEYMLIPSILALSSTGITNHAVGSVSRIPANINRTFFLARPNITITSASLLQIGNLTQISVTVKDNSNQSVVLQHLRLKMVNGFQLSTFNFNQSIFNNTKAILKKYIFNTTNIISKVRAQLPSFINNLNRSIYSNLSSINASIQGGIGGRIHFNFTGALSKFGNIGKEMQQRFNDVQNQMQQNLVANQNRLNIMNRVLAGMSINFFISSTGALFLPFSGHRLFNLPFNVSTVKIDRINSTNMNITYNQSGLSAEIANNSSFLLPLNFGYKLPAYGTVTLTFSGNMDLGAGLVSLELELGKQYQLYLQGTDGASAVYSVNATS